MIDYIKGESEAYDLNHTYPSEEKTRQNIIIAIMGVEVHE